MVLILSFASCFATGTFYQINQKGWRWRNNDGSEKAATWKADQEKSVTVNATQEIFRLRVETINATASTKPVPLRDSLQFSTNPNDRYSWKTVGLNNSLPFVMAGSDVYVKQDDSTTAQLQASPQPFVAGVVMVNDSTLNGTLVGYNQRTEHEWVIKTTSNLSPNTKYYFRQYYAYNGPFFVPAYTSYPLLATGGTLATQLTSFVITEEDKRIRLEWSAAADKNADYTNIQRSTDPEAWQTIATVKSNSLKYIEYDNSPPAAQTLYYRLQLYDKDGSFTFSQVKSIKAVSTGKAAVSVLPNPTAAAINFRLENTAVKDVSATLTDMSGKVLLAQSFKNIQPGSLNRLNLKQKAAPGVYVLKLAGNGIAESIKVIVQ